MLLEKPFVRDHLEGSVVFQIWADFEDFIMVPGDLITNYDNYFLHFLGGCFHAYIGGVHTFPHIFWETNAIKH